MKNKIIVLYYNDIIGESIYYYSEIKNFEVILINDINVFKDYILYNNTISAIIVDQTYSSLSIVKKIREFTIVPVIALVENKDENYITNAIKLGIDDVYKFPYDYSLILDKLNLLLRRLNNTVYINSFTYKDLELDYNMKFVKIGEEIIKLRNMELELLCYLLNNPNKYFTRDELSLSVWKKEHLEGDRTIDTHISNLRKRMGAYRTNIASFRTKGYGFIYDEHITDK